MKITRTINGQEIAIELTTEEMLQVYSELDEEYLREDIQQWAEDNDENISEKLEAKMVRYLAEEDDANASRWDNIENAYYACRK
jgi:hypothetical protein